MVLFLSKGMYETIKCTGKETYLQNCLWTERKTNYQCKHYSDAGVKCNAPKRRKTNKIKVCEFSKKYENCSHIFTQSLRKQWRKFPWRVYPCA